MKTILIVLIILLFSSPTNVAASNQKEVNCMARTIYAEARGEGIAGMVAIAKVILNRFNHPAFPDTICKVVLQRKQFSSKIGSKIEIDAWNTSMYIAKNLHVVDQIKFDALYFHNNKVNPKWQLQKYRVIGNHIFYTGEAS